MSKQLKKRSKLYGYRAAAEFLGISHQRFNDLVKQYGIPYQITHGKTFFEEDLIDFKNSEKRQKNLKFSRKKK